MSIEALSSADLNERRVGGKGLADEAVINLVTISTLVVVEVTVVYRNDVPPTTIGLTAATAPAPPPPGGTFKTAPGKINEALAASIPFTASIAPGATLHAEAIA